MSLTRRLAVLVVTLASAGPAHAGDFNIYMYTGTWGQRARPGDFTIRYQTFSGGSTSPPTANAPVSVAPPLANPHTVGQPPINPYYPYAYFEVRDSWTGRTVVVPDPRYSPGLRTDLPLPTKIEISFPGARPMPIPYDDIVILPGLSSPPVCGCP